MRCVRARSGNDAGDLRGNPKCGRVHKKQIGPPALADGQLGRKTMLKASNLLKGAAAAGLLALGAIGASAVPASADTIETRCSGYGDCYRVRCDDWHQDCVRMGYYRSDYDRPGRRWVCDADGDNCHWAYSDYYRDHYYYDHPGVSFGFHF